MAHRVVWSERAYQDLESIANDIADDSPAYARAEVKNVIQQTRTLTHFPRSGRRVPEFDNENIRELIAYSYRIIYRVDEDEVLISAIIHGKRLLS